MKLLYENEKLSRKIIISDLKHRRLGRKRRPELKSCVESLLRMPTARLRPEDFVQDDRAGIFRFR